MDVFVIKPFHRKPWPSVAWSRCKIKRRLRRLGLAIDPAISTHELIVLVRALKEKST